MLGQLIGLQGRIGRGTWWLGNVFVLFASFISYSLSGFSLIGDVESNASLGINLASLGLSIASMVIGVSICVKRYHDRGKSGWWFWLGLIPIIGAIWQFIELGFCLGDDGENRYGPPPGSGATEGTSGRPASASRLAALDDDYFKNYAAQAQRNPVEPSVQSTYARPTASVSPAPGFGAKAAFGKR
jgi:uncharacterized membrane protein YhaH (DUF805 family)